MSKSRRIHVPPLPRRAQVTSHGDLRLLHGIRVAMPRALDLRRAGVRSCVGCSPVLRAGDRR